MRAMTMFINFTWSIFMKLELQVHCHYLKVSCYRILAGTCK